MGGLLKLRTGEGLIDNGLAIRNIRRLSLISRLFSWVRGQKSDFGRIVGVACNL